MNKELRILLVEDMPPDAELIERALRRAGLPARPRRVESEAEFLDELARHKPDVILSDHGVPAFDGFTALERAREKCPDVPFIFVTGTQGDEVAVEALKRGADDYVLKTRLHRLAPAILEALAEAKARPPRPAEPPPGWRSGASRAEMQTRELCELVRSLCRDLRLPLRHLESLAQLLQKNSGNRLDAKGREFLHTIADSAHEMERLISALATFSRIGEAELYPMPFPLRELALEVVQELHREAGGREVQWVIGELPEITGDPSLLSLALTNLVDNALKFTGGKTRARIEISAASEPAEIDICVSDNGVGFDPALRDRLFVIFHRLHPPGEFPGLGLGLANVRRIAERHGGRAWAEGSPGQGAKFHLALPRAAAPRPGGHYPQALEVSAPIEPHRNAP